MKITHLLEVAEDRMYYSQADDFNLTCFTPDSMDRIMSSGANYIIFLIMILKREQKGNHF